MNTDLGSCSQREVSLNALTDADYDFRMSRWPRARPRDGCIFMSWKLANGEVEVAQGSRSLG